MHLVVILISAAFALAGVAMVLRGATGGWVFTLIGAIPGVVAVISLVLDRFQTSQEYRYKVEFVGDDVVCRRSDGEFESVCWTDLKSVSAFGAQLEGYTLLLSDSVSGCAIPDSADGIEKLLTRMKSLPGFRLWWNNGGCFVTGTRDIPLLGIRDFEYSNLKTNSSDATGLAP